MPGLNAAGSTSFSVVTKLPQNTTTQALTTTTPPLSMVTEVSQSGYIKPPPLHMVTSCSAGTTTPSPDSTFCVVTNTMESTTSAVFPEFSMVTALATTSTTTLTATTTTFSVVLSTLQPIYSSLTTALPVVTISATTITLTPTESSVDNTNSANLRWSRILNRPVEGNTQQLDKIDTVSKDETKGNTDTLDLSAADNKDEYFEVLNYEQDDIVHLS